MARFILVAFAIAKTSATICMDETSLLQMNSRKPVAASQADLYPWDFSLDFLESNSQLEAIRQESVKSEERIRNMYNAQFDDDHLNLRIALGVAACFLNEISTLMDGCFRHWRIAYGNWQGNMADYEQFASEHHCDQMDLENLDELEADLERGIEVDPFIEAMTQADMKQIDIKQTQDQYPSDFPSDFREITDQIESMAVMTAKLRMRVRDMFYAFGHNKDPLNIQLGLLRTSCYMADVRDVLEQELLVWWRTYNIVVQQPYICDQDGCDFLGSYHLPDGCDFLGDDKTRMGFSQVAPADSTPAE